MFLRECLGRRTWPLRLEVVRLGGVRSGISSVWREGLILAELQRDQDGGDSFRGTADAEGVH